MLRPAVPLSVFFVIPAADRLGGGENVLLTLTRHFDRERIAPTVGLFEGGRFAGELEALDVPVHRMAPVRLRQVGRLGPFTARLTRALREIDPTLLVPWSTRAQVLCAPAALHAGLASRVVWWQNDFPAGRVSERLANALPAQAVGTCSRAVAVEQSALWPHRPVVSVLPGIDCTPDIPAKRRQAVRRALGVDPRTAVVGLPGRLLPWKGQDRLLDALGRLRRAGHDVHGLIVGASGPDTPTGYEAGLRRRAEEQDLRGRVHFTGHLRDPADHIAAMDVCVNASAREPFGLVLLEAMAARVAVVAVAAGGPLEIIEDGRSGVLARDGDAGALAAAIAPLLTDLGLRLALAAGGRERFEQCFTAERMTRDFTQCLEELAAQP